MTPEEILNTAKKEMRNRSVVYDSDSGERSMRATTEAFNAMTGQQLTEEQGWLFMICLKCVRSQQGKFREDSYVDGAAYFSLMGECAEKTRTKLDENISGELYFDVNNVSDKNHAIGNFYEIEDDLFVLSQIGYAKVCLISLTAGNRFTDPVAVSDSHNITEDEFYKISNGKNAIRNSANISWKHKDETVRDL